MAAYPIIDPNADNLLIATNGTTQYFINKAYLSYEHPLYVQHSRWLEAGTEETDRRYVSNYCWAIHNGKVYKGRELSVPYHRDMANIDSGIVAQRTASGDKMFAARSMWDEKWTNAREYMTGKRESKGLPEGDVPTPPSAPKGFEEVFAETLAVVGADRMLEELAPRVEAALIERFGFNPRKILKVETERETKDITEVTHTMFPVVLQFVAARVPVFMPGPAGSGKNHLAQQVAEALGLDFYFANAVTDEFKLTGYKDAHGVFHERQFYTAFTEGGLFFLDEMDGSVPEVLIALNAAIANGYFDFPNGRKEAHDNFRVIAAGNTLGTGADIEYTGRFQLDAATLDRFAYVEIGYDPNIEDAIGSGHPEVVDFVRAFREGTKSCSFKHIVGYRAIERLVKMQERGLDDKYLVQSCVTKTMDKDDIRMVKNSMPASVANNRYYKALVELAA